MSFLQDAFGPSSSFLDQLCQIGSARPEDPGVTL
jgi:hypothetical protein